MKVVLLGFLLCCLATTLTAKNSQNRKMENSEKQRLVVVWTSGDHEVAEKVCFMYTHNALKQKWFDEVTLVVWGPSAKLLSEDKDLQEQVKLMISDGVKVQACIACANMYGVADQLKGLGIKVIGMGSVLTGYLKENRKVLTF